MFVAGERCYVQDGTNLVLLGAPPTTLIAGLPEEDAIAHEWPAGSGRLYLSCGSAHYRIEGSTVKRWGLPVPTALTRAAITGTMAGGLYLASITYRDGPGTDATAQESGALPPIVFTVSSPAGARLTAPIADTGVTHVAFYLSRPDQAELFRVAIIAVGTITETGARGAALNITATPASLWTSIPLFSLNWQPPLNGLAALGSSQAFFLTAKGKTVYRSWPGRPELDKPGEAIMVFPSDVTDIVGLQEGFYVGTEEGLFWVNGDEPSSWQRTKVADGKVLPKGIVVEGKEFPFLAKFGYTGLAALMCVGGKLIAGMPGRILELLEDQYTLPQTERVSFSIIEKRLFIGGI